jgi:hypothetical protein
VLYLFIVKDPKLPSTGIVPQSSLLETSLQSWNVKSDDIQINHKKQKIDMRKWSKTLVMYIKDSVKQTIN